MISELWCIY